jgi:NAD(P)-dependent dehydrogenase (short-subunit alcohol dehydrogenase family)
LDKGVGNNWQNDEYNWNREIVVVTGGSDGIGALIVKLLMERGIKIAVLDIQEPKYTSKSQPAPIQLNYTFVRDADGGFG